VLCTFIVLGEIVISTNLSVLCTSKLMLKQNTAKEKAAEQRNICRKMHPDIFQLQSSAKFVECRFTHNGKVQSTAKFVVALRFHPEILKNRHLAP
jgi:hypothetical protein